MALPVSYILTYRAGRGPARRRNLETVLAWLAGFDLAEIWLVEQSAAPSLPAQGLGAVKLLPVRNAGPFNKGWGFNIAARYASQPILAFGDADTVCQSFPQAVAVARAGVPVVRPFTGIVDLTATETTRLWGDPAQIATLSAENRRTDRVAIGEHTPLCGAIFLIQRAYFTLLGGWDERFLGWGGEDDAMSVKVQRAGLAHHILPAASGFHLYHERAHPAAGQDAQYRANLDVLQQVRTMSDEALKRMCEVQWQIAGNPRQYEALC